MYIRLIKAIILNFIFRYRRAMSFLLVVCFIVAVDIIFHQFYYPLTLFLSETFGIATSFHDLVNLDFAPEAWAGVLAMVLGTLIIVIAIAAESTPRLIDLYMKDWKSLLFVWFIVLSSVHAFVIMFYGKSMERNSSVVLNTYGFLAISYVIALPYIFYILLYSKTNNVVSTISSLIMKDIKRMTGSTLRAAMERKTFVEEYQKLLMDSVDQLDDLLSFVEFKETQSDIIRQIGMIAREYITHKNNFNSGFFNLTDAIRWNATYRTYTEQQYQEMRESASFFEVKVFRLLGNSYIQMIEENRYDIASLIPAELVDIGKACIKADNPGIQNHINVRFNTLFRFAIKHATRNNEPRNLYNLAFHFSNMIQAYIRAGRLEDTKVCYERAKYYGNEVYKIARTNPALFFIVDTLTFELRKCQVLVKEENWKTEDQLFLLKIVLDLDQPPNFSKEGIDKAMLGGNNGTRRIQIGLALYYLKQGMTDFAETIVEDYLDDLSFFNEKDFRAIVDSQCFMLSVFGPTYWEDTDRGMMNIYYAKEKEQIPAFKELMNQRIKKRLIKLETDSQYLSLEVENLLAKRRQQDGFLNESDAKQLEDLQSQMSIRRVKQVENTNWSSDHDLLFSLISIAFSDKEIDASEKGAIFAAFKSIKTDISDDDFNAIFSATTKQFIELKSPEAQENRYLVSLQALLMVYADNKTVLRDILELFINLANADHLIHQEEISLIQRAVDTWHLSGTVQVDSDDQLRYVPGGDVEWQGANV